MSILRFDNVSYQYPGEDFDIIDGLSFSVEPGSFHCIVGVSGCGKSTIFRMINGLLPPKAGTISVNEKPITARQCVQALAELGTAKPQYIPEILRSLENADLSRYRDSMRPLIERDIAETIAALKNRE